MNLMFVGVHNIGKTMLLKEFRKHGKTTKRVTVSDTHVLLCHYDNHKIYFHQLINACQ